MTSTLPDEVVIGPHTGTWLWCATADPIGNRPPRYAQVPVGVIIDHGDHTLLVAWAHHPGGPERVFTLDSLLPLTVVETVQCSLCGVEGRIVDGAWVPVGGGVGG